MHCPGCGENVFEEELIMGKCPLCGFKVAEPKESGSTAGASPEAFIKCVPDYDEMPFDMGGSSFRDMVNDIFDEVFNGVERTLLISYMAYDISQNTGLELKQARMVAKQVIDRDEADFEFELKPSWYDEFKVKKCDKCGRRHLMVGKKFLKGKIEDGVGEYDVVYVCRHCA
jgi:hypothetical protein